MKNNVHYIIVPEVSISLIVGGKSYVIPRGDERYDSVLNAIKKDQLDSIQDLVDTGKKVSTYMRGNIKIENGNAYYKGFPLEGTIVDIILKAVETGSDYSNRVLNLINKLYENPSNHSVNQFYPFLEHSNLAITAEGDVIAYKGIGNDDYSYHTGKEPVEVSADGGQTWETIVGRIPNKVGNIIRMPRNLVADDPNTACHVGLHVGALSYATSFAPKTVMVKFNPRDVVSVPNDHSHQKLRCCQYEVIGVYEEPIDNMFEY